MVSYFTLFINIFQNATATWPSWFTMTATVTAFPDPISTYSSVCTGFLQDAVFFNTTTMLSDKIVIILPTYPAFPLTFLLSIHISYDTPACQVITSTVSNISESSLHMVVSGAFCLTGLIVYNRVNLFFLLLLSLGSNNWQVHLVHIHVCSILLNVLLVWLVFNYGSLSPRVVDRFKYFTIWHFFMIHYSTNI